MSSVENKAGTQPIKESGTSTFKEVGASPLNEAGCIDTVLDKRSTPKQIIQALKWLIDRMDLKGSERENSERYWKTPGLGERIVELMSHDDDNVCSFAVKVYNRFVIDPVKEKVCFPGVLDALMSVLSTRNMDLVEDALICFVNFSRSSEAAVELRKRDDLLQWLKSHLADDEENISLYSTLITVGIADEEMLKKLNFPFANVDMILGALKASMNGKTYMDVVWRTPPTVYIRILTVSDKYRQYLFEHKTIQKLVDAANADSIRKNSAYPSFLFDILAALTQFALDEYPLKTMQKSPLKEQILSLCQRGVQAEFHENVRRSAEALQFVLDGKQMHMQVEQAARKLSINDKKGKIEAPLVMISYNWSYKAHAREIEKVLVKQGIKVWRDENEMNGNIIEKMAEAVSNAQFVIVLISRFYKASPNCKLECQFAHNNKKKLIPVLVESGYDFSADGWLGILLGSLLYYDATNVNTLESNITKMIQHEIFNKSTAMVMDASAVPLEAPKKTETFHVPDNPEEIRAWCKARDMEEMADILIEAQFVNANDLRDLASMAKPENLKSLFDVEIKPKLRVKLLAALKEIT